MDEGSKMVLVNPKYRIKACRKNRMEYSGKAQKNIVAVQDLHNYKAELQDTLPFTGMQ